MANFILWAPVSMLGNLLITGFPPRLDASARACKILQANDAKVNFEIVSRSHCLKESKLGRGR